MKVDTAPLVDWSKLTPEQITQKEQYLENLKQTIESLCKTQHLEVLKILKKYSSVKINENRNGVYINLSYVANEVIEEITKYMDYIKEQERNIEQFEMKKEDYKTLFD